MTMSRLSFFELAACHLRLSEKRIAMPVTFPNQSRSYDRTRDAIRFWGHQSAMEYSFFITAGALLRLQPGLQRSEVGLLEVFDANRELICRIAARVHARGPQGSYDLNATDFP